MGNVLLAFLLGFISYGVRGGDNEKGLLEALLGAQKYNLLERPVEFEVETLRVSFGLTLMQIIDVNEKDQILTTNIWLNLEWNDYNLIWNVSHYGGLNNIRINPNKLWRPDILMYNSADEGFDGAFPTNIVVRNNGSCLYVPPGIFKSTCKIDITWFPFDDQECTMKFGSWTYDGDQVDLTMKDEGGGDLTSFISNGEWELLGSGESKWNLRRDCNSGVDCGNDENCMPGVRDVIHYTCCPEPYVSITYTIQIRRRTLYYFFNLIVPCVLISSMALLGFTLPPDSGEKLTLGVTILLSLTVFLNLVAEKMPSTSDAVPLIGVTILLSLTVFLNLVAEKLPQVSDAMPLLGVTILLSLTVFSLLVADKNPKLSDTVPLLGTYFNCIMFMVASSVVLTVVVLNYHHRTANMHAMPPWVKTLFLQWLPWILHMSRPGKKITRETIKMDHKMKSLKDIKERSSKSLLANVLDMDDDIRTSTSYLRMDAAAEMSSSCALAQKDLQGILRELRFITGRMKKAEEDAEIVGDWKFAAMVVDRICLIVFTSFTIIATICVLLSAPHIIVQ